MPKYAVHLDVLRHALFDRSLTQVGDSLLQAQVTQPFRIGALSFTPAAALSVRVLNAATDKDDDAVFASDANAHLPHDPQWAWIKYKLSARTDNKLTFDDGPASQSRAIELSDYRIHGSTEGAWDAMRADLESPRTLLELEDVRRLQPGEALLMEIGGSISASVSFSWADLLSTKLSEIVNGLVPDLPIVVKLKSGLETSATVKVTDQFSVVVSRTREGRYRMAVKKAKSRKHSLAIDVSFGADASAVPAIEEVLEPIFEAVNDVTREPVQQLQNELRKRLEKVARWKASTGFAYEYSRIDENTAIADFILLDHSRLADDYALVLSGDFAEITSALQRDTGARTLVRYLNESTHTRSTSSGFSLGIGKWIDVSARDRSTFTQTTRTSLDGFRLITSRGTRKYEEKLIRKTISSGWSI